MKRLLRNLLIVALALVVVLCVIYRVVLSSSTPNEELALDARVTAILEDGGCLSCHIAEPELPFYANFPVVGKLVKQDAQDGYRAYDIAPLMEALKAGVEPSVIDVAKVEKVALDKSMPMAKYYLMHWGSQMTDAKVSVVAEWAREFRTEHYNDGLVGERAGEPVRPIVALPEVDERKEKLGFDLFHDTRLSVDNTVSCASCHALDTGGVDNHQYSHGVEERLGGVNAPTVYNAVYNFVQFWDGRAATLELQAAGPPLNPVEMGCESFDQIVAKLAKDKALTKKFKAVYPDGWSEKNITDAIAEFERTLITPNSAFDNYLRGEMTALTEEQKQGYELFVKYNCATCHVGANLGGESYELMGQYADYFADRDCSRIKPHCGFRHEFINQRIHLGTTHRVNGRRCIDLGPFRDITYSLTRVSVSSRLIEICIVYHCSSLT